MGMKERGGRIETKIIPNVQTATLRPIVLNTVEKGSTISTDELAAYNLLKGDGYIHGAVDHSRKEWAWTDRQTGERFSTNSTESFWKLFKDSINGTHIHISWKHLDRYLGEFSFRSNFRQMKNAIRSSNRRSLRTLATAVKFGAVDWTNTARLLLRDEVFHPSCCDCEMQCDHVGGPKGIGICGGAIAIFLDVKIWSDCPSLAIKDILPGR
jgi:transposase-like protein